MSANASQRRPPLAVVGLSARALASAARTDGFEEVHALDAFGDADTRELASAWVDIGDPDAAAPRIDPTRLREGIARLPRDACVIVGSGFEASTGLLDEVARGRPLWGSPGRTLGRLADPVARVALARHGGWAQPPQRLDLAPPGWLLKRTASAGGVGIRRVDAAGSGVPVPDGWLAEAERPGVPLSITWLAGLDGRPRVLGFNRQWTAEPGEFTFGGLVGPLRLPLAWIAAAQRLLDRLGEWLTLRGLGSVDLVVADLGAPQPQWELLEVNARATASAEVHAPGVIDALWRACTPGLVGSGGAGQAPPRTAAGRPQAALALMHVPSPSTAVVDAGLADALAASPGVADRPRAGTVLRAGQPLCSLQARAADPDDALVALRQRWRELSARLLPHGLRLEPPAAMPWSVRERLPMLGTEVAA